MMPEAGGMSASRARAVLAIALTLFLAVAPAQAAPPDEVPPELREWIPWVTANFGEQLCTQIGGEARCVWPGELELELDGRGGSFEARLLVEARQVHRLPGRPGAWPEEVRLDGQPAPVIEVDGAPALVLEPGRYTVTGRFVWNRLPEVLDVGPLTGVVRLEVEGKEVPLVRREGGQLWLKGLAAGDEESSEVDEVRLAVFRQIRDGSPMLIETRLSFRISGRTRELVLPQPSLLGTIPLSVGGDLALSLERSGALRVQLVPGHHEVTLLARRAPSDGSLARAPISAPWPSEEVWTWHPDTSLRVVELGGAPGIDPSRTDLPEAWKTDAAFLVEAEQGLTFKTTRRGQEQVAPSRIDVVREFWLDEAKAAFTVRDRLTGTLSEGFRLDLLHGSLGQVRVSDQDQVITRSPLAQVSGVEVREAALSLEAVSRVPRTAELSAVGWSEDANSLAATLHLPPGWDVLWASGVDEMPQTWLSRWDLFAVFFLLLLSIAAARLIGPAGGGVAFAALLLAHGEDGAPTYVWLLLVVLSVLHALIVQAKARRIVRVSFWLVGALVLVQLVAFSVTQVRHALYPHLDANYAEPMSMTLSKTTAMEPAAPQPAAPELEAMRQEAADEGYASARRGGALGALGGGVDSSSGNIVAADMMKKKDGKGWLSRQVPADAVVQTGPGIPDTVARSFSLGWSGPVVKDHTMKLVLLPPALMRALTVLRLFALGLLAYLLWQSLDRPRIGPGGASGWKPATDNPRKNRRRVAGAAAIILATLTTAGPAGASEPSAERLEELAQRLLRPPVCGQNCLSVSRMTLAGDAERVRMDIVVHAAARAAYRLPGPAEALGQIVVTVDGRPASDLRLEADGALYLRLEPGVHQVGIAALLPSDRVTVEVGTLPQRVVVATRGWSVSGVGDDGRVQGGALVFQRDVRPVGAGEVPPSGSRDSHVSVPPFFSVVRRFQLGMAGEVVTTVTRSSDPSSPEVLRLPLLPGEHVTTADVEVSGGVAVLTFPRETTVREIESTLTLPKAEAPLEIQLTATEGSAHSETWSVQCGVVWHCSFSGLVPTLRIEEGVQRAVFHPWPGEHLTVTAVWPKPSPGQSLTVESANLELLPGIRMGRGQLNLRLRTSQSVLYPIELPKEARLEEVLVDGTAQAARAEGQRVRVSLSPGTHEILVRYHQPQGLSAFFRSPAVHTGAPGVNYRITVVLPSERWLLMAGGPGQGPAILLWGYLVLIGIAALVLPRLPLSPLKGRDWFLLGLGLTQVPAGAAVFVAGWFFAIAARSRFAHSKGRVRDLSQVLLLGYTLGFLMTLTVAVYQGLVSSPDMEVTGAGSSAGRLVWYLDRSGGQLPRVWVYSVSIWVWRGVMLVWSLWLARSLLGWLRFAWSALLEGGFWSPPRAKGEQPAAVVPPAATSADLEEPASRAPGSIRSRPAPTEVPEASEVVPDLGEAEDTPRLSVPELIDETREARGTTPPPPEADDDDR